MCPNPCFAVLGPRNPADVQRQLKRSKPLALGRPVQPITSSNRVGLSAAFSQRLLETAGCSLEQALGRTPFDTEVFVGLLVAYGQDLYNSGRPYWHFSETVNAVTSLKPVLRRQCQAAWDLAYTWLAEEPSSHHIAVPAIVLVSILSACLCWGWVSEAGIFALCCSGLLRVGEATKAKRSDLVFPADALGSQDYVLMRSQRHGEGPLATRAAELKLLTLLPSSRSLSKDCQRRHLCGHTPGRLYEGDSSKYYMAFAFQL